MYQTLICMLFWGYFKDTDRYFDFVYPSPEWDCFVLWAPPLFYPTLYSDHDGLMQWRKCRTPQNSFPFCTACSLFTECKTSSSNLTDTCVSFFRKRRSTKERNLKVPFQWDENHGPMGVLTMAPASKELFSTQKIFRSSKCPTNLELNRCLFFLRLWLQIQSWLGLRDFLKASEQPQIHFLLNRRWSHGPVWGILCYLHVKVPFLHVQTVGRLANFQEPALCSRQVIISCWYADVK